MLNEKLKTLIDSNYIYLLSKSQLVSSYLYMAKSSLAIYRIILTRAGSVEC